MEAIQVQGKPITGSQFRAFLGKLAESVPATMSIISGVESTNPYETLCSFAFDGGIINVAILDMKGGEA